MNNGLDPRGREEAGNTAAMPAVLCRRIIAAALLAACVTGASAKKEKVYLDAFGGDPVVSSEVGAEPQNMDDPELLMPTGTCDMPGIELKECSHDCVYSCQTPMCTWGCVCACNTQRGKAKLLAFLKAQTRSTQVLASQNKLSKAVTAMQVNAEQPAQESSGGFLSNPLAGVKFPAKKKGVNPRLMGHKLAKAQRRRMMQRKQNPFVDGGNFDWAQYDSPHRQEPAELAGYAQESATINDVFDPMEDPYNLGDRLEDPHGQWWAFDGRKIGLTDNWWEHGGTPKY